MNAEIMNEIIILKRANTKFSILVIDHCEYWCGAHNYGNWI